ncbi:MAG: hypothetical protein KMY55_14030 [Dethiosulfatibacter sp.]|nr:hypothetical protein [Dethiosulfatibacter sp.]
MYKIKELIKVQSSYSAQVNLKREYSDRVLNVERMSNYRPIKSHRKAFEIIAEGAYRKDSKRCFILSGSYGTGKSHLSLMAANYFESPSGTPEMESFFENYADSEADEPNKRAEQLKGLRKQGRYLVSVCDYGANKFERYILKGIKEALQREEIPEEEMDSYYLQAIKKIDEWKKSENDYFYDNFEKTLEKNHQPWTVNKLKSELSLYYKEAIEVFKDVHKAITTTDFEYDKDNYVEIISQLTNSKIIRERFLGLIIFYDEFDYQLNTKRFDLDEFQKFAHMCAASFMSNFPVIFVATTHRSFASYKNVYNAEDFMTVNDRIKEIPLATEGIEEIISAIVSPQKDSYLWEEKVKPKIEEFNKLANVCQEMKIFNWLSAPKVRKRIIENIYPMHPMATYSLLKLAEDVGSNNRSVFTFFADEKEDAGSYDWFVKNNDITDTNGELQFYTLDLLFDYFKDKLNSDNQELRGTVKDYIRNYETSLRELGKQRSNSGNLDLHDKIYEKILRTMVIYQIIGTPINFNALKVGMHINTQMRIKELEYCLIKATKNKIIYLNETNYCYEFRRSDAVDINGLIKEYKDEEENIPVNLVKELEKINQHEGIKKINKFFKDNYFLEAVKYNFEYNEDKRLKREFVSVKDLESDSYVNELLEKQQNEQNIKQSYEGIAVYVFCENEDEVKRANAIAKRQSFDNIMIGVPIDEIPILDEIFSLKAAISIKTDEFQSQDIGMLKDYTLQYEDKLKNKLERYINSENLVFYGKNGLELSKASSDSNESVKKLLESIYEGKRNLLKHEELNLVHEFKDKRNNALREAVEILLDFTRDFYYRNDVAADRGDIRYFHKVLMQTGVVKSLGQNQNKVMCEIEVDFSKYAKILPALSDMISEIKKLDIDIRLVGLINDYMKRYGIGYNAIILSFAILKRYFKDSITIKAEPSAIGSIKITNYDVLLELLYDQKYQNAMIRFKEINVHDESFINHLYGLFTDSSNTIEKEVTVDSVYDKLYTWYKGLDNINKVAGIYQSDGLVNFISVFSQIENKNSRDFILEEIKCIYGYDKQDLILTEKIPEIMAKIKKDKELIEQGYYSVRDQIVKNVKEIFEINGVSHDEINKCINSWFVNLSDFQRNYNNDMHNDESRQLVLHLGTSNNFEELITEILPKAYNMDKVKSWRVDKSDSFTERIRKAKKHIEENIFLVQTPKYELNKDDNETQIEEISESIKKIKYRNSISITIIPNEEHHKIYITSNDSDPKLEQSQREETQERYQYITENDSTLKFGAIDKEGRWSRIVKIDFINEDKKFEVKYVNKGHQIGIGNQVISMKEEHEVQMTLPRDVDSLKQSVLSIITETVKKYKLDKEQCIEVLKTLIEDLRG